MSQQRPTLPPLVAHGPDNKGAVIVVVSYSWMFISILFGLLRTWTSYTRDRGLRWDDLVFSLAVLLIIPESILTERAVGQGLGRHISTIAAPNLVQYYKYIYQTQLLGILVQFLAKFAVVLLIERLADGLATKKSHYLIKAMIGTWSVFSLFTIAFQCNIGQPWEFTRTNCAAGGKLYYLIITGTIATDCIIALYFIPVVWKLQLTRAIRLLISSFFSLRLVVCAVGIAYLAQFPEYLSSDDKTWHNTNPQILHQVVINLSVITTGILGVRRFLSDLQTGRLALVISEREIEMTSPVHGQTNRGNNQGDSSQNLGAFCHRKGGNSHHQSATDSLNNPDDLPLRPIVRNSPNSLSFSRPSALRQIYGSRSINVRKSKFYELLDSGPGAATTHTEIDKEKHAARRRILSHAFSDAALRDVEVLVVENVRKLVGLIGGGGADSGWTAPRNMSDWCNWLAYDIMGALVFDKTYNCLGSEEHRRMPVIMTEGTKFGYWFAYLPFRSSVLQMLATTPLMQWLGGQTARDNAILVSYAISQFEERAALEKERKQRKEVSVHKDLMHYLLNSADSKTGARPTSAELKGDALSLIGAGADTIATTLAGALFYLSRNPSALLRVQSEVRSAFNALDEIHTGPKMDSCHFLHACIEETLRLSPPVAAPLPREVMKGGIVIDGHYIPEGTVVGVPAYVVHHDKDVFPDPWSFVPERWMVGSPLHTTNGGTVIVSKEGVERARQAICPFSLGSRGCIGKPVAYLELRIALASLVWTYDLQETKGPGNSGGGGSGLEEGRERVNEYQLFDCFGSDRDGPILRFRRR
ncbi:hypothetical protein DV735_g4163, partial [Chaetothyriales sp. CBS 134920]